MPTDKDPITNLWTVTTLLEAVGCALLAAGVVFLVAVL